MKKILVILICLLWVNSILAQREDHTYNDGDYIEAEVTYNNVTISSSATFTIKNGGILTVNGTLTNNGTIIIEDGGQLVGGNKKTTVTVKKSLLSTGWYTIASSVQKEINVFSGSAGNEFDLYYYKESNHTWMSLENNQSDEMFSTYQMGQGFLCAVNAQQDLSFTGKIQGNDIYVSVTNSAEGKLKGFNLIGNPYAHNIYKGWDDVGDRCSISSNKLASGYYKLVNDANWRAYDCAEPIKPCEAILIKTSETMTMQILNKTLVATQENSITPWNDLKTGNYNNTNPLVINVNGNSGEDRAYAYFYEGIGLDKIDHISETAPSLSIRYEDVDYAIAHVDEDSRSLDVIFKNNQSGFFTLSVDTEKANFNYLHLIDNVTGDEVDMLQENSYKFYAFGNEPENRFKLVMNPNATTTDDNVFAYVSNGDIVITGLESAATLQVFDVMGRMVSTEVVSKAEGVACRTSKPSVTGVYVLRLISENGIKTQKIVVE